MTESIFQIGISNAVLAGLMALAAILVGVTWNRPKLSHCLWLLVLIKLVTPPIYNLPMPLFGATPTPLAALDAPAFEPDSPKDQISFSVFVNEPQVWESALNVPVKENELVTEAENSSFESLVTVWESAKPWLGVIWLGGTILILIGSLFQILRFHQLLQLNRMNAGKDILRVAKRIQKQLLIKNLPMISITNARISPMVWWVGGRVHVIMPQVVIDETNEEQWQWILAHEMAHVCRRDYLVRWLEWLACTCFWWNPIFWLAQRNLRAAEEICCDELVLSSLNANSFTYANSILAAVESLVIPEFRPPAMASEMNSGGFLKRRINMILNGGSKQSSLRSVQYLIAGMAMLLIPIGFVQAQDFDAIKKRLTKAVKHDEITLKQAAIMMEALRESQMHDHEHEEEHHEHEEEHGDHEHGESEHGNKHDKEMHEREMHEREMHEREMREREMHELEMRERDMHAKEMHERVKRELAMREQEIDRARAQQDAMRAELEAVHAKLFAEMDMLEKAKAESMLKKAQASRKDADLEAKYKALIQKLEAGVRAGKISKQDAKKKMDEYKYELWPEAREKEELNKKREFEAAQREIKKKIELGQISREDGMQWLNEIKKKNWGDDKEEIRESREKSDREAYNREAKKLKAAVEAGKISKRQAEERFLEMRRKMEDKKDDDDNDDEDEDDE